MLVTRFWTHCPDREDADDFKGRVPLFCKNMESDRNLFYLYLLPSSFISSVKALFSFKVSSARSYAARLQRCPPWEHSATERQCHVFFLFHETLLWPETAPAAHSYYKGDTKCWGSQPADMIVIFWLSQHSHARNQERRVAATSSHKTL